VILSGSAVSAVAVDMAEAMRTSPMTANRLIVVHSIRAK
jgi:hypothetical protein